MCRHLAGIRKNINITRSSNIWWQTNMCECVICLIKIILIVHVELEEYVHISSVKYFINQNLYSIDYNMKVWLEIFLVVFLSSFTSVLIQRTQWFFSSSSLHCSLIISPLPASPDFLSLMCSSLCTSNVVSSSAMTSLTLIWFMLKHTVGLSKDWLSHFSRDKTSARFSN